MWATASFSERLRGIASIHGANMATDRLSSLLRMAPKIRFESCFACADIDNWAPPENVRQLQAAP